MNRNISSIQPASAQTLHRLRVSIWLQALSEMSHDSQKVVWVPDEHNILRPAADLTFDDASWLDSPEMDYAHKTLSKEVGHTHAGSQLPPT